MIAEMSSPAIEYNDKPLLQAEIELIYDGKTLGHTHSDQIRQICEDRRYFPL